MPSVDLQLDWLRTFVAVVDAGSLSAAAPLVHRSQAAVSMQLKKLEEAAGRALLLRGPRHLQLTDAGRELLGHARRLLEIHAEAIAALQGPTLTGSLRLGVPDDYAERYLTPVLRSFAGRHTGVEITLDCEQSTALVPKVARGEIDIAIVSRDRPNRGRLLFHEPLVWAGSPEHELWRRELLPVAAYETGSAARSAALDALSRAGRGYRVVYNSANRAGMIAAVASGLAVAALTRCSVPPELQVLDERHGLPPMPPMAVALYRSRASARSWAADALQNLMLGTLARAET